MRSGTRLIDCVRMLTVVAMAACASSALGGPIRYTLNNLPANFRVTGMSDNGIIVGFDTAKQQSALYQDGSLTYLSHVPSGSWLDDSAKAVNDSGQVGWASDGVIGLNNSGEVAGNHSTAGSLPFATNSSGTESAIPSPVPGNPVNPYSINDSGAIVGWMGTLNGDRPFLYENGKSIDLGLLQGSQGATAFDINNSGQVVGGSTDVYSHPFLWDAGKLYDLGSLGGSGIGAAFSINDAGQIVGWSSTANAAHAFLYESGRMYDLNDLINPVDGLVLSQAIAIDNRGDIVVEAISNGSVTDYILAPAATVVPEPSSLVIFLTLLTILATTRLASRKRERGHSWLF